MTSSIVIDREALAWAAGLFDGEGSTHPASISRFGGVASGLALSVGQAHPEVLERFRLAVGGMGTVSGPRMNRKTQMWTYRVHSFERVQAIVAMLWPFLGSIKRAQATAALRSYVVSRVGVRKVPIGVVTARAIRAALARGTRQIDVARTFGVDPRKRKAD